MPDLMSLLVCLSPLLSATSIRQLSRIVLGLLALSGRVTLLGISRWSGPGGSYRTVQRFFGTVIPWASVLWVFFRHHLFEAGDVYLLAGDGRSTPPRRSRLPSASRDVPKAARTKTRPKSCSLPN